MTDLDKAWREAPRIELKHRLAIQLYDYKYSLQHATNNEAMAGAALTMGAIHEMWEQGLLTPEETAAFQAQVRADFAERVPQYLSYFDELLMWEPKP